MVTGMSLPVLRIPGAFLVDPDVVSGNFSSDQTFLRVARDNLETLEKIGTEVLCPGPIS